MAPRETTATIRTASGHSQKEMVGAKPYLDVEVVTQAPLHRKCGGLCHNTGFSIVSAEAVSPLSSPSNRLSSFSFIPKATVHYSLPSFDEIFCWKDHFLSL